MDVKHHATNPGWGLDGLVWAVSLGAVALIVTAAVVRHIPATCRFLM